MAIKGIKIVKRRIAPEDVVWETMSKIVSWCQMPYKAHKHGCPNVEDCHLFKPHLRPEMEAATDIMLIWTEWDLEDHAKRMKASHPQWTDRQCRNLLYWQKSLRKQLIETAKLQHPEYKYLLGAEGIGINFYRTMQNIGINMDIPASLKTVRMILFLYKNNQRSLFDYN